ncbi:MAG: methylthioribulose 1-phosphate dehydratase [Acidobacteria bacterium]|nr:methylthioribulose 1-phosphate dehydratase [Acidobacteriota bacterium]
MQDSDSEERTLSELVASLAQAGHYFYGRQWAVGTSGNFSAVSCEDPLRLVITSSGADKGALAPEHFTQVDEDGKVVGGRGNPSAETELHLLVVRTRGARAVLHTHSVWGTLVSDAYAAEGGVHIENYEMLKGLSGVRTHEHREWLPIIRNTQHWPEVIPRLEETLRTRPDVHGFLVLRHGLYTWGASVAEARRHVEIFEFLLEVLWRSGRR